MKKYSKFNELQITSIAPEGWLRHFLINQRNGLTGHLEDAGHPFNTKGWGAPKVLRNNKYSWWPYEQTGYWIDGMIRTGYLLKDDFLIKKAKKQINYVMGHADKDGFLGPKYLKKKHPYNLWPYPVFFRSFMADYSATKNKNILDAITRHYGACNLRADFGREICNIEIMLWVYEKTGNKNLLESSLELFKEYNKKHLDSDVTVKNLLSNKKSFEHGVTYNEIAKLGAIIYLYTGNYEYLNASINAYKKIDKYHMLIDGICSSTERLTTTNSLDSHETCDIADYVWSNGYLLMATGNAKYADRIERACFNAAPGAVTSDFKALQYFSCPNQVIADRQSNHNLYRFGESWMSYRPNPGTECCPGEVNRIMPNFAARMWMDDREGLVAVLYGPSRVTKKVGKNKQEVEIVEETSYPFSERIDFQIRTKKPVKFPLTLRIPSWCKKARLLLNGKLLNKVELRPGTFAKIKRKFGNNDIITLVLPMELKLTKWPKDGIGIERGPLVYSLKIKVDRHVDKEDKRSTKHFPAWNLYPKSSWNYALSINNKNFKEKIKILYRPYTLNPWDIDSAPIELNVPARKVKGWGLEKKRNVSVEYILPNGKVYYKKECKGKFILTPELPDPKTLKERLSGKEEIVTLVPYGCTELRITIFPQDNTC